MWPLILDFVETYFGEEDLAHFKKYFSLTIDHSSDPIVKAGGLQAMLACFLKNNKNVLKEFKEHIGSKGKPAIPNGKKSKKEESSSEEEEESSGDEASSSSEDAESSSSEDEKSAPKKNGRRGSLVGSKRKAKEESSDEESDESSEDDDSESESDKKKKKPAQKRQRADSISGRTRSHSDVAKEVPKAPEKPKGPIVPLKFARINEEKVKHLVNMEKEGASFESKGNFGGEGDKFGQWSYDRLKHTRGESFKKEKGKMKNRNFHSAG